MAELRQLPASLWLDADRARRQLTLTLPLPVVQDPKGLCPMLAETMQWSLDGRPPVQLSRGSYHMPGTDCWSCQGSCDPAAKVVFDVPLEGGLLQLLASSPTGEASITIEVPAGLQPTIVNPQTCYARGEVVALQLPPEFLPSIGLDSLPIPDKNSPCPVDFPLCFRASLYAKGGDFSQISGGYSDGVTVSVFVPTNAVSQIDDLYLTYRMKPARPLAFDACNGFAYCDGEIGEDVFAPVTIEVCG